MERVPLRYYIFEFAEDVTKTDYYSNMTPSIGVKLINASDDKVVGKVKDISLVMQNYGLSWSEKYDCYTISHLYYKRHDLYQKLLCKLDEAIKGYNNGEEIVTRDDIERETRQSYFTGSLYRDILCLFPDPIDENSIILDPAAGEGNLLSYFQPHQVIAIEPNEQDCEILKQKEYYVIHDTFEESIKKGILPSPTHIIMNPPFSNQRDIIFFNLAYELLQNSGSMSAIVSENSIWEELKNYPFLNNSMTLSEIADILINSTKNNNLSAHMKRFLKIILETYRYGFNSVEGLTEVDPEWGKCTHTSARMFAIKLRKPSHKIIRNS